LPPTTRDWSAESDERLVAALADDAAALGPLYDRHARLVYGLAVAILGNQGDAEDLTQEVFLTLCKQSAYDSARGSVGAYLTTLTRSRAIDRLRHRGRTSRVLRVTWQTAPPPEAPPTPHDDATRRECTERVRRALAELGPNERQALELAYYQGLTQQEIAERLDAPIGTVKSWCRRGMLAMRDALGDLWESG
jgi:RNA polymerase sigma-70 factor (ECF subfamily)